MRCGELFYKVVGLFVLQSNTPSLGYSKELFNENDLRRQAVKRWVKIEPFETTRSFEIELKTGYPLKKMKDSPSLVREIL